MVICAPGTALLLFHWFESNSFFFQSFIFVALTFFLSTPTFYNVRFGSNPTNSWASTPPSFLSRNHIIYLSIVFHLIIFIRALFFLLHCLAFHVVIWLVFFLVFVVALFCRRGNCHRFQLQQFPAHVVCVCVCSQHAQTLHTYHNWKKLHNKDVLEIFAACFEQAEQNWEQLKARVWDGKVLLLFRCERTNMASGQVQALCSSFCTVLVFM